MIQTPDSLSGGGTRIISQRLHNGNRRLNGYWLVPFGPVLTLQLRE